MTRRFRLLIDPVIWQLAPSFNGVVVYVDGIDNAASDAWSSGLLAAAERAVAASATPPRDHPHMQAWASVYRQFGARPKLYKNGCLALAKRECVPRINVLVDMYNAVAMTYMLPIGGEDWDALQSNLLRTTARGNEEFIGNEPDSVPEHPCRGEPIWLDRAGVTTRRFNWRQAWRTRITPSTRAAYFVLDTVAPYTPAQLGAATQGLLGLLHQRWPKADTEVVPLRSGVEERDSAAVLTRSAGAPSAASSPGHGRVSSPVVAEEAT